MKSMSRIKALSEQFSKYKATVAAGERFMYFPYELAKPRTLTPYGFTLLHALRRDNKIVPHDSFQFFKEF